MQNNKCIASTLAYYDQNEMFVDENNLFNIQYKLKKKTQLL